MATKNQAAVEKRQEIIQENTIRLAGEMDKEMESYAKELSTGKADVSKLKGLDKTIAKGDQLTKDVQELISGLTAELDGLAQKLVTNKDYNRWEKMLAVMNPEWADRSQLERLKSQNLEGSMKTALLYTRGCATALMLNIEKNAEKYNLLRERVDKLAAELKDKQGELEKWSAERQKLEDKVRGLKEKIDTCQEAEYGALNQELERTTALLDQARLNESNLLEIVRNAKECLPVVRHHRDCFYRTIEALQTLKTHTEAKMRSLQEVFTSVQQLFETAKSIKGASRIDQTINKLTEASTEFASDATDTILKETEDVRKREVIEKAKLGQLVDILDTAVKRYEDLKKELKKKYEETR